MAPVGRQVSGLLRHASAALGLCAVLCAATAQAQVGSGPAQPPSNTTPLPPLSEQSTVAVLRVVDIRLEGNRKHTREAVLNAMTTRIGHAFDQAAFEKDIRTLTSRSWFVHVVPKKQFVPGGVVITLSVIERPVLEYVRYFGNDKVRQRALEKETGLKANDPFDPYAVREAARKIEALYQAKGFSGVTVDIPEGTKPGDRGAVFLINEGKKVKFSSIDFEGNDPDVAPDGRLKKVIQSRTPILFVIKGEVDYQTLSEDVQRLLDYYRGLGFFKATVGRKLTYNRDEDRLAVTFHIHEGPRYNVRNVSFLGNRVFPSEALMPTLKLEPGDPFDQSTMRKDISTIKDLYGSNGYVFADAIGDLRFDLEPGVVDIIYQVDEQRQYVVGDINVTITGDNPHTRHATILNRLDFRPGDVADTRKFRASERRIQASGLFNVDPSKGDMPRITFPPPEFENLADDERRDNSSTADGRRPGRPGGIRGQSPDGSATGQTNHTASAPTWRNGTPVYSAAHSTPATGTSQHVAGRTGAGTPQRSTTTAQTRPSTPTVRGQSPDYSGYGGQAVNPVSPSPQPYVQPYAQPTGAPAPATATAPYPQTATPQATYPQAPAPQTAAAPAGVAQAQYAEGGDPREGLSVPRDFGSPPLVAPPGDFLGGPEGLPPSQPALPVTITASEAQTGRFMLGAGINSNAGLVGSIILDEQNFDWRRFPTSWEDFRSGRAFRGGGQKFRIEAAPGTEVQRYLFNFSEPFLFDTPVALGLSGYYFNRYYRDWMEQRVGGRITWGYQFTPDFSGNIGLRAEDVLLDPTESGEGAVSIDDAAGHSALYSVKTGVAHDTRDSTFLPTEGHYITANFEYVMGTYYYPQFTLNGQKHWLLRERPDGTGRHTFSYYHQLGFSGDNTPVYERFFAGGFSTLRGFYFRGASPTEENASLNEVAVGGIFQFLNSLEYMFPVTADDSLRGVMFVDFGTVEPTIDTNWSDFRVSPGMGIRVTIPAISPAPIAIDIAAPVARGEFDRIQNVSFFVGVGR